MKTMLSATMALLLLVNPSSGGSLKRLTESLNKSQRRLIENTFNDKICVDYGGFSWLTRYDGDYTYTGMSNGKPAYEMTTCRHSDNCNSGHALNVGTNGKWQFGSQTNDPFCNDVTDTPDQCTNWWGGQNPTIHACGNEQSADNGVTQEETDQQLACETAGAEPKRTSLTQADKDELLRQFNVQRTLHDQSKWTWSYALEMVAQESSDMCQLKLLSGDEAESICKQHSDDDPDCWAAGFQGIRGPSDNVNSFLWDGYKNGYCDHFNGIGLVWGFMENGQNSDLIKGEAAVASGHKFTSVGCAYKYCESIRSGGGYLACSYM